MKELISHPKYRADIDGLRAVAVSSVVIFHAFPELLGGGFAGVDVFFVISGFLISTILFDNIDRGTFSISDFYFRRVRRIFPALAVVLFSVLCFGWFCLFPDELRQLGKHTARSVAFIQNFTLWKESGYFDSASDTKPLLHIWSLGIEEQFYFFWPVLLWIAAKFGKKSHQKFHYLVVTLLMFVISFALGLQLIKVDPTKTFYLPQYRFWELAVGGFLAWIVLYKPSFLPAIPGRARDILSLVALVGLLTVFVKFNQSTVFPGKNALLPVTCTFFIIFAGSQSVVSNKILSNKILVWIGLVSFPLYLWHWPILSFGRVIFGETPSALFKLFAIASSVLLAWLTVEFIEKPFRFKNTNKNSKVAFLCATVLLIGLAGLLVKNSDGYFGREKLTLRLKTGDIIGLSDRWFRGKSNWLFLGNAFDRTVSKLKLTILPKDEEVAASASLFAQLAQVCQINHTKLVLLVGPDKPSIYPEYLPDELVPSNRKYVSYFLEKLKAIPNLTVYDPTDDLLGLKRTEGMLYWKTDTHWNNKGAFLVFKGFAKRFNFPIPQISFHHQAVHYGDIYGLANLKDFPVDSEDNWEVEWPFKPTWTEQFIPDEHESSFSKPSLVSNPNPIIRQEIWVVGDSFTTAQRQYLNASFSVVRYIGHWSSKLKELPMLYADAKVKPNMILVIRVERSF